MEPDFMKYDVFGAAEGADSDDITQAVGYAAEESLRSIGNLLGGDTGVEVANSAIDGMHFVAKSAADAVSSLLDW